MQYADMQSKARALRRIGPVLLGRSRPPQGVDLIPGHGTHRAGAPRHAAQCFPRVVCAAGDRPGPDDREMNHTGRDRGRDVGWAVVVGLMRQGAE